MVIGDRFVEAIWRISIAPWKFSRIAPSVQVAVVAGVADIASDGSPNGVDTLTADERRAFLWRRLSGEAARPEPYSPDGRAPGLQACVQSIA